MCPPRRDLAVQLARRNRHDMQSCLRHQEQDHLDVTRLFKGPLGQSWYAPFFSPSPIWWECMCTWESEKEEVRCDEKRNTDIAKRQRKHTAISATPKTLRAGKSWRKWGTKLSGSCCPSRRRFWRCSRGRGIWSRLRRMLLRFERGLWTSSITTVACLCGIKRLLKIYTNIDIV
jgi:hypothetical protein